jgi:hypothetical protein
MSLQVELLLIALHDLDQSQKSKEYNLDMREPEEKPSTIKYHFN